MSPFIFKIPPPAFTQTQQITASDPTIDDYFGQSVAIDGDYAVVSTIAADPGGVLNAGAAYIFENIGGVWTEVQKITASDKLTSAEFGWSVAISGSTIVVGARTDQPGGLANAGSAYVFERSVGGLWPATETQKLIASDKASSDQFGFSVSISADIIVVGTQGSVSAYVYEKAGTWPATESAKVTSSDFQPGDKFGTAVSIVGSTIVVSSPPADQGAVQAAGAVYVYEKAGTWPATETQKLIASDPAPDDNIGSFIGFDGNTIVASAFQADPGGINSAGAVYVYEKAGTWPATETQKLIASDPAANDLYSFDLDVSGTRIVLGAFLKDPNGINAAGGVYIFEKSTSWTESEFIIPNDALAGDNFGRSISISTNTFIVSSYSKDANGLSNSGSAYFYVK